MMSFITHINQLATEKENGMEKMRFLRIHYDCSIVYNNNIPV